MSSPNGRFGIDVYRPDTYAIEAKHLAEGYPDTIWGFYGRVFRGFAVDFPVVTVDDTPEVKPIKVKLGPKAGRVIFTIVEEETNKPVEKGAITVCRAEDPRLCWSMSTAFPHGRFDLLTPDVPFTVKFETWETSGWVKRAAFDKFDVPIEVLQVDLGARKEITVRLK